MTIGIMFEVVGSLIVFAMITVIWRSR